MDKQRVEFRLDYPEDSYMEVKYFDTLNELYSYITNKKITTFVIVKEELIASRLDTYHASSKN